VPTAVLVAILAVSALATSFISGILGMAGGLILMGILLALMSVPSAMMLHGTTQLASNGWRAFLWRTHIDWRVFRGYLWGSLAVLAAFIAFRFVVSKPWVLITMGLTPFVALVLPPSLHLNVERRGHSSLCGAICAALSLTAGVSGPILDTFFVRSKMSRHAVVATKASTQSLSHLLKIGYFGGVLAVGGTDVAPWVGLMMVAFSVVGTTLSTRVLERMTDNAFRLWTRRVVMTIGVAYLASGVRLLVEGA
jgi:uncharacterized membrane protein YfcA